MDAYSKMRNCECGVIDTSPNVNPPYCMIYGEDWSCAECKATDEDKHKAALMAEEPTGARSPHRQRRTK